MRARSIAYTCVILLLPFLAVAAGTAPAAALSFAAPAYYAAGHGPVALAVADVSGDDILDVVTADSGGDTVSVLLGDGTGGFTAVSRFATGDGPAALAVADVNGDGDPDVVTANARADTVSVLLGDGAGGFDQKTDFATGALPEAVAVGDFNDDGKQDLVTADSEDDAVSVLLGTGGGGFSAKTDFHTGPNCNGVAVGDFDSDGHQDLAISFYEAMEDSGAGVLLGDGMGAFSAMQPYLTPLEARTLAIGDMNGDGHEDLVVAQSLEGTGEVSLLLGDGAGAFTPGADRRTKRELLSVALGDVDGDGHLDVMGGEGSVSWTSDGTSHRTPPALALLRGDGRGGLMKQRDFATGADPWGIAVADLNGGGQLDLVTANGDADTVGVRLNGPLSTPVIRGISPVKGGIGAVVTLTGKHFGAKRGRGAVSFGDVAAIRYLRWSDTAIKVRVPAGTAAGDVAVTVRTAVGTSAARHFLRL